MNSFFNKIIGFIIILLLWYLVSQVGIFDKSLLPDPISTIKKFIVVMVSPSTYLDIRDTIFRLFTGYTIAGLIGIVVGMIIGSYQKIYDSFEGIIDSFRSIPVTTLYPVFVLTLGIDHLSKIGMVFWACIFVIILNSAYGVIQSSKIRTKFAMLHGATKIQIFRWITLYDALPQTLIGLRVSLSLAIIVEILCEMFMGSEYGIGQRIIEAFTTYAMEELFVFIIIAGIIGYLLNKLFVKFERLLVPWVGK